MVIKLEYYDPKITEESLQELTRFLKIVNKTMGYSPTVIGGWAVYYYVEDQMSQDIDVVMPDEESYYKFIENDYFRKRGFSDWGKGGDSQHFGKLTTDSKGKPTTIRLDVMFGDKSQKIKKLKINKDWRLVLKNQQEVKFKGYNMYVPKPELLTTLKIIGALERQEDLRFEDDPIQRAQFLSKIKKDFLDIADLAKKGNLQKDILIGFYKKTKVVPYIEKFLLGYDNPNHVDILDAVDIKKNELENFLSI